MNVSNLFENVSDASVNNELQNLLNRIMAITNPMDFDDDFATDAQLEALEDEMDRLESRMPELLKFLEAVKKTKASETTTLVFI